jgi:hypothetical protein
MEPNMEGGCTCRQVRYRLVALGAEPETMTPSQLGALIANATEKWAKVISFASIKVD